MNFRHKQVFAAIPFILALTACPGDDGDGDEGPCVPLVCEDRGRECGVMSDGCGSLISCGECPEGSRCNMGACHEVCVPDCDGKCGGDDGCDGACPDRCSTTGRTCNEGTGECEGVCVPRTCLSLGFECGSGHDDWCGGTVDCGDCIEGAECKAGTCGAVEAVGLGDNCEFEHSVCSGQFPQCVKLVGAPAFCTRECSADGQCGTMIGGQGAVTNCCVPIGDKAYCVPAAPEDKDLAAYFCEDPTDPTWCTIDETCLPSPLGSCVFCFLVGSGVDGDECDGFNSCNAALACVKLAGQTGSTCQELCDPEDRDACVTDDDTRHCEPVTELGRWGVCADGAPECVPADLGDDCPTGWNCIPDGSSCTSFVCARAGGRLVGESCTAWEQCAPGGYCVDGTCRKMCSAASGCPDTFDCVQGCSTKVKYCTPVGGNECNPLIPDWLCLTGQTCVPDSLADCSAGTCYVPGKTPAGGGCDAHSDCVTNTMCYDGACRRLCTLDSPCDSPAFCFFVCGGSDLGVCMTG